MYYNCRRVFLRWLQSILSHLYQFDYLGTRRAYLTLNIHLSQFRMRDYITNTKIIKYNNKKIY